MSNRRSYKQALSQIADSWQEHNFQAALAEVEQLRKAWPGNAHLMVLWSQLVQLQEDPVADLDEVRRTLRAAIDIDKLSPAPLIELGHFLDAVDDNPDAALKSYADGVALARTLLLEGLLGQAKVLLQLDKREEARRCALEIVQMQRSETGRGSGTTLPEPLREQLNDLLSEIFANRSA